MMTTKLACVRILYSADSQNVRNTDLNH